MLYVIALGEIYIIYQYFFFFFFFFFLDVLYTSQVLEVVRNGKKKHIFAHYIESES